MSDGKAAVTSVGQNLELKPIREFSAAEIADVEELFGIHGRAGFTEIVRGMRHRGYKKFGLSHLVGRESRGLAGLQHILGWPPKEPDPLGEDTAAEVDNSAADQTAAAADFPKWLAAVTPGWKWTARFQTHVIRELDGITRGRFTRLMIFMPPRHGKSELVTVRYATWRLLREPALRIVVCSYNQRLANRFSRRIRELYLSAAAVYRIKVDDGTGLVTTAVDEWETSAGGGVKAVGAGAGITGFGADLIIIDDPIKSRAKAESRDHRDAIWEWYHDDLTTRLEPDGAIILIQTRWHEDDLAGRLLARRAGSNDE